MMFYFILRSRKRPWRYVSLHLKLLSSVELFTVTAPYTFLTKGA